MKKTVKFKTTIEIEVEVVAEMEYWPETGPSYSSGGEPAEYECDFQSASIGKKDILDELDENILEKLNETAWEKYND